MTENVRVSPVTLGADNLWEGLATVAYAVISGPDTNPTLHAVYVDETTANTYSELFHLFEHGNETQE